MGRPALVAFLTSLVTTVAVFAGLTVAERHGHLEFLPTEPGSAVNLVVNE